MCVGVLKFLISSYKKDIQFIERKKISKSSHFTKPEPENVCVYASKKCLLTVKTVTYIPLTGYYEKQDISTLT